MHGYETEKAIKTFLSKKAGTYSTEVGVYNEIYIRIYICTYSHTRFNHQEECHSLTDNNISHLSS